MNFKDYDIEPKDTCLVKGILTYSRLGKKISGDERTKRDANSQIKHTQDYYTISIKDAQVIPKNPQMPTPLEKYVAEKKIYTSSKYGDLRMNYDSTSKFPIPIYHAPNNEAYKIELVPEDGGILKELANGLTVEVIINAYPASKSVGGVGSGIGSVIVKNETIDFYKPSNSASAMIAGYGYHDTNKKATNYNEVNFSDDEPKKTTPEIATPETIPPFGSALDSAQNQMQGNPFGQEIPTSPNGQMPQSNPWDNPNGGFTQNA